MLVWSYEVVSRSMLLRTGLSIDTTSNLKIWLMLFAGNCCFNPYVEALDGLFFLKIKEKLTINQKHCVTNNLPLHNQTRTRKFGLKVSSKIALPPHKKHSSITRNSHSNNINYHDTRDQPVSPSQMAFITAILSPSSSRAFLMAILLPSSSTSLKPASNANLIASSAATNSATSAEETVPPLLLSAA